MKPNKKKTKLIIGLSIVILIALVLSLSFLFPTPFLRRQEPIQISAPAAIPQVTTTLPKPNQFIWQINHLKLPSKVELVSTSPNTQGETILKNLASKLGFNGEPSIIPNSSIIFYSNPKESADIYLNTDENIIQFTLDLTKNPLPKKTSHQKTISQINQTAMALLQKSLYLQPSISINKTSARYQNTNGPRFVNSSKDKAALININYAYSIKSLPVMQSKGVPIGAIYSLSGKLVKLSIYLPPQITPTSNLIPVKTIPQIKDTPADQFTTIALSGNQQFTLSDQEIDIGTATINNGFLGYLAHQNSLYPYIFLTGATEDPQYGQIELLIATPANSQQQQAKQ